MIDDMSPLMRRFLALGLFLLIILLLYSAVLGPSISRMNASRDRLADSQYRLAKLQQLANRQEPPAIQPVPPGLIFTAKNMQMAQAQMLGQLQMMAKENGLATSSLRPLEKQPIASLIAVEFVFSGPEVQMMTFIERLENASPMLRLRSWKVETNETQPEQVTLTATLIAAWQKT
jgi:hypothetical protein